MPEKREEFKRVAEALSASPFYRHIRMRITKIEERSSEMWLELGEEHKNIWGTIHGGAIASLLDSTCGSSLYSSLEQNEGAITIDLRVNFFAPPQGSRIIGKGSFIYRTKRLAWSQAEAYDEKGNLIARAQAIHRIVKRNW